MMNQRPKRDCTRHPTVHAFVFIHLIRSHRLSILVMDTTTTDLAKATGRLPDYVTKEPQLDLQGVALAY